MKGSFKLTLMALAISWAGLSGCTPSDTNSTAETSTAEIDSQTEAANTTEKTVASTSDVPVQGVTDNEIVIGGVHDLSGIFAAFSAPAVKAANQYFDEVNAAGGVHGRKIRYVVEDHGYQVPKAVQATNKLINRDKIFAMLMNLGTPHNLAAFPIMDRNNVPSVMPLTFAKPMQSEGPFNRRYTLGSTYYDSMKAGINYLIDQDGVTKLCVMYIPSDFGEETHQAALDIASENPNVAVVEATSHRPDETDFSGTLARLKDADCGLVATSLGVRSTIGVVGKAKAMGWDNVKFIAPVTSFHSTVASAPGGASEGLYAVSYWNDLNTRANEPATKAWVDNYTQVNGDAPSTGAVIGYLAARTFVAGLEAAGPELNADTLNAGLETVNFTDDVTGVNFEMNADNHVATKDTYLSQVQDGLWKPITKVIE
ncbi:MAG: ABC transporter substrate-binding protein [Psychrobacter sp.]|nr:ABC transporter substrate-binding protein [Psychrobacter sp.]